MSTGGGTTTQTTVQNSAPWGPAQPYLTDLMSQAQNLYNTSSQDRSYAPFNTVAPLPDQTQGALLTGVEGMLARCSGFRQGGHVVGR